MLLKGRSKLFQILKYKRKRKFLAISVLSFGVIQGYISFLISSLVGFIIAKYLGGKEAGKRSKLPSITLPLGKYEIHLHHWLISSAIMALGVLAGSWVFPEGFFYGFASGIAFQGIYCYNDWHKILTRREGKSSAVTEG